MTKAKRKKKKKKKLAPDELERNREILAEARRRRQAIGGPLAMVALCVVRFGRHEPLLVAAYMVPFVVFTIHSIVGYRRLKAELGLAGEYDQLDENAAWGAKTFVILFGGFAVFFVLLFLFISFAGKH